MGNHGTFCCYNIFRQIPCFPVNLPLSEALALFLPDCVSRHVATWITWPSHWREVRRADDWWFVDDSMILQQNQRVDHWEFQDPKLEVPTIYKAFFSGSQRLSPFFFRQSSLPDLPIIALEHVICPCPKGIDAGLMRVLAGTGGCSHPEEVKHSYTVKPSHTGTVYGIIHHKFHHYVYWGNHPIYIINFIIMVSQLAA